jgi:hypothetical protein
MVRGGIGVIARALALALVVSACSKKTVFVVTAAPDGGTAAPSTGILPGEGMACSGGQCTAPLACTQGRCIDPAKTYVRCREQCSLGRPTVAEACDCTKDSAPFSQSESASDYATGCGPSGAGEALCCRSANADCSCAFVEWRCLGSLLETRCQCMWRRRGFTSSSSGPDVSDCSVVGDQLHCCAIMAPNEDGFAEQCSCRASACGRDEREVASCNYVPETPTCPGGTQKVASCQEGAPEDACLPKTPAPGPNCRDRGDPCTGDDECCSTRCCGDFMGCC